MGVDRGLYTDIINIWTFNNIFMVSISHRVWISILLEFSFLCTISATAPQELLWSQQNINTLCDKSIISGVIKSFVAKYLSLNEIMSETFITLSACMSGNFLLMLPMFSEAT